MTLPSPKYKGHWALGLMTGTSADGIDVAALYTDGQTIQTFLPGMSFPYTPQFQADLKSVFGAQKRNDAINRLEDELTTCHAEAAEVYMASYYDLLERPLYLGFHGQTIWHRPPTDEQQGATWQLGDAELLAELTNCPVVYDFRSQDMANRGQGAPLVPLYHQALIESHATFCQELPVVFVNIGGVANVTYWDGKTLLGFDVGPGNALLDDYVSRHSEMTFDEGGQRAQAGQVDAQLLQTFLEDPFFQKSPPKSLDRKHFHEFLEHPRLTKLSLNDALATLCALTVQGIVQAQKWFSTSPKHWIICGGGRHHQGVMNGLKNILENVHLVDEFGWPGEYIEAHAFAFLAIRVLNGLPTSLPTTTGVKHPVCGGKLVQPGDINAI